MNKKIYKKKSRINNLLNKLSFLTSRNRYRRRSKLNAVPYMIKSNPQKYGPGRNLSLINLPYYLDTATTYRISLESMLLSNPEFSTKKLYFRYFKVLEIRAVFQPSGITTDYYHYLNFSWTSIEESTTDISKDDCTKVVPYYRPRTRIVKWRPIRSVINVNSVSQEVPINFINMTEFISTDRVVSLPGWLYVSNTAQRDNFILEVLVEFRGNDYGDVPKLSKIKEMKSLIEKWEIEIDKRKKGLKENKIIDLLPAYNLSDNQIKDIKEEIQEEDEEYEEKIQENFENEIGNFESINKNKENNLNLIENINKIRDNVEDEVRKSISTNSRVKDINNLEPQIKNKEIHNKNSKEDKSFIDIEDPIFPLKFYENKFQERWTGKEEIISKLNTKIPILKETEIKREKPIKSKEKKENMINQNKILPRETSHKIIPSCKISEIT